MNVKGRAKEAAFLSIPHILQPQGNMYKAPKYYCSTTRSILEQKPEHVKGVCYGCGVAKLTYKGGT